MGDSRSILWRAIVNSLINILIAVPILWLYLYGKPTERGFFCNDESIRHPYLSSTVPAFVLYIVGFVLPLLVIAAVEAIGRKRIPQEGPLVWGRYTVPSVAINIYFVFLGYLFGLVVTQCLTDIIKYSVGRLRPHFLAICNPDFDQIDCGTEYQPIYVTDYVCRGNASLFHGSEAEMRHRIKEGRFLLLAAAVFTAISRVMDYKHHPGDVIGGGLLGTIIQTFNVVFIMKLFSRHAVLYSSPEGSRRISHIGHSASLGLIEGGQTTGAIVTHPASTGNGRLNSSASNFSSMSHPL